MMLLRKHIFILYFLMFQIFPTFTQAFLMEALDDFQCRKWQSAADKLYALRKQGGMINFKYLEYMKTNKDFIKIYGPVNIPDDYNDDYDPIPEWGVTLSSNYLKASLAYIDLGSANQKKFLTASTNLYDYARDGNTHAINLFEKALKNNPNRFKNHKILKNLKDISYFDQFVSEKSDLFPFWGIMDPTRIYWMLDPETKIVNEGAKEFCTSLKIFKKNYDQHPTKMRVIIENIIKLYPKTYFWLHLAFENGITSVCPSLFNNLWNDGIERFAGKNVMLEDITIKDLSFLEMKTISLACYYASKIKQTDNIKEEELSAILLRQFKFYDQLQNNSSRLRKFYETWAEASGNAHYQCALARMKHLGEGGPVDYLDAWKFYELSAAQENAIAQYNLAHIMYYGEGRPIDIEGAWKFYEMSAAKGYANAQYKLAHMMRDHGRPLNLGEARRLLTLSAAQGHAYAQNYLAVMMQNGEGGPVDFEGARKNYEMSALQGNEEAQFNLAQLIRKGEGTPIILEDAYKFYKMSADQGYAPAKYNLAVMLYKGWGTKQNLPETYTLMQDAAKTLPYAKASLARMLYRGEGCLKNVSLAIKYAQIAADEGEVSSQFDYPVMLYTQQKNAKIKKDTETILKYLKMAANNGDTNAQYAYACILLEENPEQNQKEAWTYLTMSAKANNMDAIILLNREKRKLTQQKTIENTIKISGPSFALLEKQISESENQEKSETITLLEEEKQDSFSQFSFASTEAGEQAIETEIPFIPQKIVLESAMLPIPEDIQESKEAETFEKYLEEELKEYEQQESIKHTTLRKKKLDQKQARVDLRFKKTSHNRKEFKISSTFPSEKTKIKVPQDAVNFVKIVFGEGDNKFTNYTNKDAKALFEDLGCVAKQKKNENSTVVSFDLGEDRIVKLKYHNPHPDDNLYFAMKRYMKRFLECIHRTPEHLMAK